jgi:DnaJ domain
MDETDSDGLLASGRYDWALELLGIERDAKVEEAKFAYRKLALKYHPDRNPGDKQAEEQFKRVDSAWKALEDILPPSPIPLEIPDGASEEEIEAIYVKWLLNPDQRPRAVRPRPAPERQAPEKQGRHEWSTVASENTGKAMTTWEGSPQKDWTRLWIKRGKASRGLESITADEAALLIYSRPHAFAALKVVQRHNPALCLYDAVLERAQYATSAYKPQQSKRGTPSTALVIRGTDVVDTEACKKALIDPWPSYVMVVEKFAEIATQVQFQGKVIQLELFKHDIAWLHMHMKDLIEKCATRRVRKKPS